MRAEGLLWDAYSARTSVKLRLEYLLENRLRRYQWPILRVAGFVLLSSCLLYIGLRGWLPAYYLYLAIMNLSTALYMMIVMAIGFSAELFGWIPSGQSVLVINGAIIISVEILQG